MRHRLVLALLVSALALALAGCGGKKFGISCERAVDLPANWTALGLPVADNDTRVCEASSDTFRIHSYTWGNDKNAAAEAFRQALTSQGYVADQCNAMSCSYWKDNYSVNVHPMDFQVRGKSLVRLVVRRRADNTPPRQS